MNKVFEEVFERIKTILIHRVNKKITECIRNFIF